MTNKTLNPADLTDAELAAELDRLARSLAELESRLAGIDPAAAEAARRRDAAELERLGRLESALKAEAGTLRERLAALQAERQRRAEEEARRQQAAYEAWAAPWRKRVAEEEERLRRALAELREAVRRLRKDYPQAAGSEARLRGCSLPFQPLDTSPDVTIEDLVLLAGLVSEGYPVALVNVITRPQWAAFRREYAGERLQ